jgi:long-subunit fatty acid transport protein
MKTFLTAFTLMILTSISWTQDLGPFEEITAGNFFGIGAGQMAMGGAGIAATRDGAALYYNPAALARIHRIEFQVGLTHEKWTNTTSQPPDRYTGYTSTQNSASIHKTKTRFGSFNLALPVPTYRGSLTLAFGVHRFSSFDQADLFHVIDRNGGLTIEDYSRKYDDGGIYLYSGGLGVDVSPSVSLGLALNIYAGKDRYNYYYYYIDDRDGSSDEQTIRIEEDYIGVSIKGGLLARPNSHIAFGLTIESPLDYQVGYTYIDDYEQYYIEYDLKRPFVFGAGFAVRFSTLALTGDAEYIDWGQLNYNDNRAMEYYNILMADLYRDVVNLRAGAEFNIASAGLSLRGGVFSNPLPYKEQYIQDDRIGYSFGLGWLIDGVLMLEGAYVNGTATRKYTAPNADFVDNSNTAIAFAEDEFERVYFTLSYRY